MHLYTLDTWTALIKSHTDSIGPHADAFVERRSLGQTHPIHDFLFTYYRCSPTKLKQWVPSFEEGLITNDESLSNYPWLTGPLFDQEKGIFFLKHSMTDTHRRLASFVATLCKNMMNRPPRFGCFGLHEWAMVYKAAPEYIRHQGYALRLPQETINQFVESQTIACTHYDAYRFFTEEAKPLNILNPRLETRLELEQGGCIHANMDLYKWSSKLWPWIGSDFLAKTFLLALEARILDMRASPYDFSHLYPDRLKTLNLGQSETKSNRSGALRTTSPVPSGQGEKEDRFDKVVASPNSKSLADRGIGYSPIYIETEEGRTLYQQQQQIIAKKASILREGLHNFCLRFLSA